MSQIVWSQEISIPTPRRVTKNSEGGGSQKPKYLEETLKPAWNLQELEGSTQKPFSLGGGVQPHSQNLFSSRPLEV